MRAASLRHLRAARTLAVLASAASLPLAYAAAPAPAPPLSAAPAPIGGAAPQHTDADTGLSFPTRVDGGLFLAGTACRYKYGFAKVYAVALYVAGGARALGGAAALEAVQNGALPAGITIKLARNVGAKDLAEALQASISPQVIARGQRDARDPAADLAKLAELGTRLTDALGTTLPVGTEVAFRWVGAGDLHVAVNGRPLVVFGGAPLLCGGFFATYVSQAPLIPAAREAWIAGINAAK